VDPETQRIADGLAGRYPGWATFSSLPNRRHQVRRFLAAIVVSCVACRNEAPPQQHEEYIYVWAGDSAGQSSDFLGVIDASPSSPTYGGVVGSTPTGVAGTHPHHTEATLGANNHLLANGFHAGRTWLYDLSTPKSPRILTSFGDLGGYSHPHSYVRLPNGNVLATFQYKADSVAEPATATTHAAMAADTTDVTGGLIEMDERGTIIRSASGSDPAISDRYIYPYSVLPIVPLDRALSTTTDMNEKNTKATSPWIQLWRLSDLTLLRSIALPPGPRGNEQQFAGEPLLLPDGKSAYVHTFNCGLYLVRGLVGDSPTATFVRAFDGINCGVPVLTGHYWIQTVPETHALVSLDISDPEHPREVATLKLGDDEQPHWLTIDGTGRRLAVNSAGGGTGNRLFVVNFDPATGRLTLDERFRDAGATQPGVSFTGKTWPHGFTGKAVPHGTVFSR
jgi:hypothetical protein